METNKKILAIIPARSGSKGIPNKNITDFGGHPLLAYSIATARLSKLINRIIISTDKQEYAEIAKKYKCEAPFLRPKEYAEDLSLDKEFFKHALNWLEKNENYVPDLIVHLRPTVPLRQAELIDKMILEMLDNEKATSLRTGHIHKKPGHKLFKKKGDYIEFFGKEDFQQNEEYYDYPRQDLPITYTSNGYVDIIKPEILKQTGQLHGSRIKLFVIEEVDDIDSLEDLKSVASKLNNKKYKPLLNLLNKI